MNSPQIKDLVLAHPDGCVHVQQQGQQLILKVEPNQGVFTPIRSWETKYSLDLVKHVLDVKGLAYLCDEIMRDEYPLYVQHAFEWDILSYVDPEAFRGKRVLDFGSGSGASSMVLARMFPETEFVGVELVPQYVELARHRAEFYGINDRVRFALSPDGNSLPSGIGEFDYIVFSAVYEHLLPEERKRVLPLLWSHLKDGGVTFLDQTPYRWFPVEQHTTGLPLINYLPSALALRCSRRWSARVQEHETWRELLRKGIRGGTTGEIMSVLADRGAQAELIQPSQRGVKDHIDLWYQLSSSTRRPTVKKLMMWGIRCLKLLTGVTMIPTLSLAIRKNSPLGTPS